MDLFGGSTNDSLHRIKVSSHHSHQRVSQSLSSDYTGIAQVTKMPSTANIPTAPVTSLGFIEALRGVLAIIKRGLFKAQRGQDLPRYLVQPLSHPFFALQKLCLPKMTSASGLHKVLQVLATTHTRPQQDHRSLLG